MQLDDLKDAWAAHGVLLERSLAINERLLREVLLRKVRRALAPYAVWRAFEVALGIGVLVLVLPVLAAHLTAPRYLVAGGAVALYAVGITALSAYLLVGSLRLDHGGPVTALQRDLEHLRLVEYHALKWALLGGVVVWLPVPLLLLEALTGFEALARVDLAWLLSNLVFGLVVLAVGQVLARRHLEHSALGAKARRVVEALSARGLRTAKRHLAELARFEREG